VGKAHFRSAAFGGAPHFVRRKNTANAAFLRKKEAAHSTASFAFFGF